MTNNQYSKCPVCELPSLRIWRNVEASGELYKIDRCNSCAYACVNPRPTLAALMDFYHALGESTSSVGHLPSLEEALNEEVDFPNSTLDAARIMQTLVTLLGADQKLKFLDVGCGHGFFSKAAQEAGFAVTALELSDHDRKLSELMTGIKAHSQSYEDFEAEDASYDAILMSQTLEHSFDVNLWVNKAFQLLRPGGVLVAAVPNFGSLIRHLLQERDPFIIPPQHLNYFDGKNLAELFIKHGFSVEAKQWISRLPKSSIEQRMPAALKPAMPLISTISDAAMVTMDFAKLGMIINVYGRKPVQPTVAAQPAISHKNDLP